MSQHFENIIQPSSKFWHKSPLRALIERENYVS